MSKKRVSPIRNTFDDDMSFAELMGLKGMDDREAVKAFMAGGLSNHEPSFLVVVVVLLPAKDALTFSPGSAVPKIFTAWFLCRTM